jgi:hypothetical protein
METQSSLSLGGKMLDKKHEWEHLSSHNVFEPRDASTWKKRIKGGTARVAVRSLAENHHIQIIDVDSIGTSTPRSLQHLSSFELRVHLY